MIATKQQYSSCYKSNAILWIQFFLAADTYILQLYRLDFFFNISLSSSLYSTYLCSHFWAQHEVIGFIQRISYKRETVKQNCIAWTFKIILNEKLVVCIKCRFSLLNFDYPNWSYIIEFFRQNMKLVFRAFFFYFLAQKIIICFPWCAIKGSCIFKMNLLEPEHFHIYIWWHSTFHLTQCIFRKTIQRLCTLSTHR